MKMRQCRRGGRPDRAHPCFGRPDQEGQARDPDRTPLRGRQKNFTGERFWARGYFVSTVGLDEAIVRAYIRNQEEEDERYERTRLGVG
jgi:REP element-mobilizing transposase RayT